MGFLKLGLLMIGILAYAVTATTYIPLEPLKQIEESDGILHGLFIDKDYKKSKEGFIITEAKFKVLTSAGIPQRRLYNKNEFKVSFVGGTYNNETQTVDDYLNFKKGEEVVLFLKRQGENHFILNMGLGKYEVYWDQNVQYLRSVVFPTHPSLGRISYEKLNSMSFEVFGEPLKVPSQDKFLSLGSGRKQGVVGRSPSSDERAQQQSESSVGLFWLVGTFAFLGAVSHLLLKKQANYDET